MDQLRPAGLTVKHDGITRAGIDRAEERAMLYALDQGICQGCGRPVEWTVFQIAHRIADTRENRHKYGAEVVDSIHNKAIAHPWCNDKLNCGRNPARCAEIVKKVEGKK